MLDAIYDDVSGVQGVGVKWKAAGRTAGSKRKRRCRHRVGLLCASAAIGWQNASGTVRLLWVEDDGNVIINPQKCVLFRICQSESAIPAALLPVWQLCVRPALRLCRKTLHRHAR